MEKTQIQGVFNIVEGEHLNRPVFIRIGTAFTNSDGSLNIRLDSIPLSGRLHVRESRSSKYKNMQSSERVPVRIAPLDKPVAS